MKRNIVCAFSGGVICLFMCALAWAQATAQISGSVKDQTGAVLRGVEVTATQADTGIARRAVTNETSSYMLPSLRIAAYWLGESLVRFRVLVQTGSMRQVSG